MLFFVVLGMILYEPDLQCVSYTLKQKSIFVHFDHPPPFEIPPSDEVASGSRAVRGAPRIFLVFITQKDTPELDSYPHFNQGRTRI